MNLKRTDPVSTEISFNPGVAFSINITDADGHEYDIQLNNVTKYADGSLKKADVHFIAKNVPQIGYKTYYIVSGIQPEKIPTAPGIKEVENRFYKIDKHAM